MNSGYIAKDKDINLLYPDSQAMFRKLVETLKMGVYMADAQGTLFYVNQAFVDMLGYSSKEELLGRNLAKELYAHPADREVFIKAMADRGGYIKDYQVKNIRKDGSIAILSATSHFIRNDRGEIIGAEGAVHDITERVRLEERLQSERNKLEQLLFFEEKVSSLHKLDELVDFIVKKSVDILNAKKCSLMLFDHATRELCIRAAKGLTEEVVEKTRVRLGDPIAGIVAQNGESILVTNLEYDKRFQRNNRNSYASRSFMIAPIKVGGKLLGVINVADKDSPREAVFTETDLQILSSIARETAVSMENAKLYKELEYLAVIDPMTSLCNYRCFVKDLNTEIERSKRFGAPLSLLMLDIDNFKSYNDRYGHPEGDHLLRAIAETIRRTLRAVDEVSRYGGDEFSVILPETSAEQAQGVALKLLEAVANLQLKEKVGISIGIAEYTGNLDRLELVSRADRALYRAKREGKNRVCL